MLKTEQCIFAYTLTLLGALNLACGTSPVEGSATGTEGSSSGTEGSASGASNTTPTTTQGSNSNSATDSTVSGNSNSGMTEATTVDLTTEGLTGTGPDTETGTTGVVDTSDSASGTSTGTPGTDTSTGADASTSTDASTTDASTSTTGDGTSTTGNGTTGDIVECGLQLKATIRDFKLGHPDFETYCCGVVKGLVKADLGADKKPVFNQVGNPKMLTDAPTYNQWYNNTKDVNQSTQIVLDLQEIQPGVFSYQNNAFFPIDNQLFGNEGNGHNFHFTTYFNTS